MFLRLLLLLLLLGSYCHLGVIAEAPSKKILILAQGRSGSTFLSSWFGSLPNVNYFIEPCSMVYGDSTRRDRTGLDCANFIKELFACDFSRANVERNQTVYIPEKARKAFRGWGHQGNSTDITDCKKRTAHVAKELRMGMSWAKRQVDDFDKVIVLFRDPRAIMNSRQTDWPEPMRSYTNQDEHANPLGWNGKSGFPYSQSIRSLCVEHLALRERVEESNENHVLAIEYADVLKDSLALSKRAIAFTGLEEDVYGPIVAAHVERNLNGNCLEPDKPFSVCRTKVPSTDDKWRKTLSMDTRRELHDIDECAEVVARYYTVKDEL